MPIKQKEITSYSIIFTKRIRNNLIGNNIIQIVISLSI